MPIYNSHIIWQNRIRSYVISFPPSAAKFPAPIVFGLHGGGGSPTQFSWATSLIPKANERGYIVVLPQGSGSVASLAYWQSGTQPRLSNDAKIDDLGFLGMLMDMSVRGAGADPTRMYFCGISNGAHMTHRVAGFFGDRLAAIGVVAGLRSVGQYAVTPKAAVPLVAFHGSQDTFLPIGGGTTDFQSFFYPFEVPNYLEALRSWAIQNKTPEGRLSTITPEVWRLSWRQGLVGTPDVDAYICGNGGHTWPGGRVSQFEIDGGVGPVCMDIDATELMLDFFDQHRRDPVRGYNR